MSIKKLSAIVGSAIALIAVVGGAYFFAGQYPARECKTREITESEAQLLQSYDERDGKKYVTECS